MERRLGANLDDVRIHTGERSAQLGTRLDAEAFTLGHDVFFATRLAPATSVGNELLTHELAHVLQNRAEGDSETIRRSKKKQKEIGAKTIEQIIDDPTVAHRSWDKLSEASRQYVLKRMTNRYGADWVDEFQALHQAPQLLRLDGFDGLGGQARSVADLQADGWALAARTPMADGYFERWVHPNGATAQMVRAPNRSAKSSGAASKPQPPAQTRTFDFTQGLRQPFGRETNYATIDPGDPDVPFFLSMGGHAIKYVAEDGLVTIEFFAEGSTTPQIYQGKDGTFRGESKGDIHPVFIIAPEEMRAIFDPVNENDGSF